MAKWITCKSCGHEYSSKLGRCPECSRRTPLQLRHIFAIAGAAAVCIAAVAGFVLGLQDKPEVGTVSARVKGFESSDEIKASKPEPQVSVGELDSSFNSSSSKVNTSSKAKISSQNTSKTESKPKPPEPSQSSVISPKNDLNEIVVVEELVYVTLKKEFVDMIIEIAPEEKDSLLEITEEDRAIGITEVKQNTDGSITATFKKSGYDKYIAELNTVAKQVLGVFVSEIPFLKSIDCTSSLETVKMVVNETDETYSEETIEVLSQASGLMMILYQGFMADSKMQCKVEIVSANDSALLQSYNYPQDFPAEYSY